MPKGNQNQSAKPVSGSAATRQWMQANPAVKEVSKIVAGVKKDFGYDISVHTVYSQRSKASKKKPKKTAGKKVALARQPKEDTVPFFTKEGLMAAKELADKLGSVRHAKDALDLIESFQQ